MPVIIDERITHNTYANGTSGIVVGADYERENKQRYPEGWDLRPGKPTANKICEMVMARARESSLFMSAKHTKWREFDKMLCVYIPHDAAEKRVKAKDSRKPISLVVPESYAILETIQTYLLSAYGRDPFFKLRGTGPEDVFGAIMLEKVIETQVKKSKLLLDIHTLTRDALTYGVGFGVVDWQVKTGKRIVVDDVGYVDPLTGEFVPLTQERKLEDAILYEGSKLFVIDPYKALPDISTEMHNIQAGEYFGWKTTETYNALRKRELAPNTTTFNCQYLRGSMMTSSIYKGDDSGRQPELYVDGGDRALNGSNQTQNIDTIYMYIEYIPSEHDLGDSDVPETRLFGVSGDSVVIEAALVEPVHDRFPAISIVPDYGGHELMPVSRLELNHGLQELMNFMINTFMYEARKNSKNRFIADPKSINMNDVYAQSHVIRTRKTVWGSGVRDKMEQLQVHNVTENFIDKFEQIRGIGRNDSGAVDSLQGLQRQRGERVTAEEFSSTRNSALSRLQKTARIISLQALGDLGERFAKNTQLYMSQETYVQTVGRWEETLRAEYGIVDSSLLVSPYDLNVNFDIEFHDGSVEGGDDAAQFLQYFGMVLNDPELRMVMDISRMALHAARISGVENATDFKRLGQPMANVNVQADQQVGEQAASGKLQRVGAESNASY